MAPPIQTGGVRVDAVSRSYWLRHERTPTLKGLFVDRSGRKGRRVDAVRDVSLDVAPGDAVALVGANGSGKSTLLKLIGGIIPPDAGSIEVGGSIAAMLELGAGFHPDFTGRENAYMNAAIHGLTSEQVDDRLDEIVAFAELPDFIDAPIRTYSSGMQMRLAFAIASHVNPDVLLLDEVLAVGDEGFQRKCMERIERFLGDGGTLVFVSHDAGAVEAICNRALLMDKGRPVAEGTPQEVFEVYRSRILETVIAPAAEKTGSGLKASALTPTDALRELVSDALEPLGAQIDTMQGLQRDLGGHLSIADGRIASLEAKLDAAREELQRIEQSLREPKSG